VADLRESPRRAAGQPDSATQPDVDVVVVSYNSAAHLRGCVEPIAVTACHRVIVVDNASSDASLASIADLPVTVVAQEENRGFAHGCNAGWKLGSAPYVLLLNPDSEITPETIETLVSVLDADRRVGIAGPRIVNSDGSLGLSQHRFPRLSSTFSEAFYLHHLWPRSDWSSENISELERYEQPCSVDWLSGACLLVRRELLVLTRGLDESFFLYSEDMELCRAAWALGFQVRFEPRATVLHVGGASAPRAWLLPVLARSRMVYASKNNPRRVALGYRIGIGLEAVTHAAVCRGGWPARRGYVASLRATLRG
jgi:N-acetylglucosaminyl-diphospho-decaprenol L-rhamnosyltransferase